jgi:hypothetical protein
MKKTKEAVAEIECPACKGTGYPKVQQPVQPGRKIFPPPARNVWARVELNHRVLEGVGVEFIPARNGNGVGVRLIQE